VATINSGNSTTLYSTTQTTTSVNTATNLPQERVNETNFTTLYSNTSASAQGGGTSGNLLVSGNLRVLGTSDLEGAVLIGNSYTLPTSDGTSNQVIVTDGNGNLTFQNVEAIDNIPDGTAKGQVLYWDGSDWTASSNIRSSASANRLFVTYENSTAGTNAAQFLEKDYGATNYSSANEDGVGTAYALKSNSQGTSTFGVTSFRYSATDPKLVVASSTDNFANYIEILTSTKAETDLYSPILKINSAGQAVDSYIYLKGSSVFVKYNNSTDFIEMPRTAINNILLNTNTISTTTGGLVLDSASGAVNVDNDLYIGGIAEVGGEYFKINSDNTNADTYLYMKGTGQYLKWDITDQLFVFNKSLYADGAIIAGGDLATNNTNIYFNNDDGAAADCFLGVKRGASPDVYIKWNEATTRWQFTNDGTTYYDMIDAVITPPLANGQLLSYRNSVWQNDNAVITTVAADRNGFIYRPLSPTAGVNVALSVSKDFSNAAIGTSGAGTYTTGGGSALGFQVKSDSQGTATIGLIATTYSATNPAMTLNTSIDNFASNTQIASFDTNTASICATSLILDSQNGSAGRNSTIYANRGSSGTDASFGWIEADQIWSFAETVYSNGAVIGGSYIATNGNNIYFNNDDVSAADSYLTVKRGASADVSIRWNEGTQRWQDTTDGSTYYNLPNQNLDTNSDVTFASVTVDGGHTIIDTTTTTTTTISATAITTTSNATTRSSKFQIQVTDNVTGNIHVLEALVFFQGTTAYLTTYAEMYNSTSLATFTADVDSGNTRLLATPASTNSTTFKVTRISVAL